MIRVYGMKPKTAFLTDGMADISQRQDVHRERKRSPELISGEICLRAGFRSPRVLDGNTVVKCACHTRLIPFTTVRSEERRPYILAMMAPEKI